MMHEGTADLLAVFGNSPLMRELSAQVRSVAPTDQPVLLVGEVGVGKSRVARAIHALSHRAGDVFADVECSLPEAAAAITEPRAGTLYLEEVASLPATRQSALYAALGQHDFARVIASSSLDLATEVTEQRFDEALYYRLGSTALHLPPLRARAPDDIARISAALIGDLRIGLPGSPRVLSDRALVVLTGYHWPGNLRELRNVLERALLRSRGAPEVDVMHLPVEVLEASQGLPEAHLARSLADVERSHIERTLRAHGANRTHAARALGISRATLIKKIRDFETADRTAADTQESA